MEPNRPEGWSRPFMCALCGRRAADKFTIEHHVQYEHSAREQFVPTSVPAPSQLRPSNIPAAGHPPYAPPFRNPDDGSITRSYLTPSSLSTHRYRAQPLTSARGELLGWKTVIDPTLPERLAPARPSGSHISTRQRYLGQATASSKRNPWTESYYGQQAVGTGATDQMRLTGSNADLDQRQLPAELPTIERGPSYMAPGGSTGSQMYPPASTGSSVDSQKPLHMSRESTDSQRQPHLDPPPMAAVPRYLHMAVGGSPTEGHHQGQLAGSSLVAQYQPQATSMSSGAPTNGPLDSGGLIRPVDAQHCHSQPSRPPSDSLHRHANTQRSSMYTTASTFNQFFYPYTGQADSFCHGQTSGEPAVRLPATGSLADDRGNVITPEVTALPQLYPTKGGPPTDTTMHAQSEGASSAKGRNILAINQTSYFDSRRGPNGVYPESHYYQSAEPIVDQQSHFPSDNGITIAAQEHAKQGASSLTELGSYSGGPRHIVAQDRLLDSDGNLSTGLHSGHQPLASYESLNLEQVPHQLADSSARIKRDLQLADQCVNSQRPDLMNSAGFQSSQTAQTCAGQDSNAEQDSIAPVAAEQVHDQESGIFGGAGSRQSSRGLAQASCGARLKVVAEKREAADEAQSTITKRRHGPGHQEIDQGKDDKEDPRAREELLTASQEDETDEVLQSVINTGRCKRCGCAVRGQCGNPSSLIEPDKIVIITSPGSATTTQVTISTGEDAEDDVSEAAQEVVLPDPCYSQPSGADGRLRPATNDAVDGQGGSDPQSLNPKNEERTLTDSAAEGQCVLSAHDAEQMECNPEISMPIDTALHTHAEA
ncbi:hypothetical protein BIW11_10058 [Tropilaelaps mercedesae]|uniref:C2H2-type domain-containing protein n=1 Tax=Tropilaelaps mercedesae TaxID=418985 RepID=A0A1V9XHC9_9ACAR|nr:hypothetical protein BIW11_10058 [Tropilaelaps mercedesae]